MMKNIFRSLSWQHVEWNCVRLKKHSNVADNNKKHNFLMNKFWARFSRKQFSSRAIKFSTIFFSFFPSGASFCHFNLTTFREDFKFHYFFHAMTRAMIKNSWASFLLSFFLWKSIFILRWAFPRSWVIGQRSEYEFPFRLIKFSMISIQGSKLRLPSTSIWLNKKRKSGKIRNNPIWQSIHPRQESTLKEWLGTRKTNQMNLLSAPTNKQTERGNAKLNLN